jgi:hypothetical protein
MFAESHANAYLLFYQRIKKTLTPAVPKKLLKALPLQDNTDEVEITEFFTNKLF